MPRPPAVAGRIAGRYWSTASVNDCNPPSRYATVAPALAFCAPPTDQLRDLATQCLSWRHRIRRTQVAPPRRAPLTHGRDVRLRRVVNKPGKLAKDAWRWLKNAASDAWQWLKSAANDAWQGLTDAAKAVRQWLKNATKDTWRWLTNAARWVCSGWRWLIVVAAVAAVIGVLTAVVGLLLTHSYEDSTHRWVAWTGILAAATLTSIIGRALFTVCGREGCG